MDWEWAQAVRTVLLPLTQDAEVEQIGRRPGWRVVATYRGAAADDDGECQSAIEGLDDLLRFLLMVQQMKVWYYDVRTGHAQPGALTSLDEDEGDEEWKG